LLIFLIILLARPGNVTNVFRINVVVVEENIFQMWNQPDSVHSILSYIFSTIII